MLRGRNQKKKNITQVSRIFNWTRRTHSTLPSPSKKGLIESIVGVGLELARKMIELQTNMYEKANKQATLFYRLLGAPSTVNRQPLTPPTLPFHSSGVGKFIHEEVKPNQSMSPSIEKLFAELKKRREQIQSLHTQLEESLSSHEQSKKKLATAMEENKKLRVAEALLKKSFYEIDQKYLDLRNDHIDLNRKETELRKLKEKCHGLEESVNLHSKKSNDPQLCQADIDVKDHEISRLLKRIERLRMQSPGMVAFSNICSRLLSTMSKFAQKSEQTITEVHRLYSDLLQKEFPRHLAHIRAIHYLAELCEKYVMETFPLGRFDCTIYCSSTFLDAELGEELKRRGFILSFKNDKTIVASPKTCLGLGAYGIFLCVRKSYEKENGKLFPFAFYPMISSETIEQKNRVFIEHEKARSSKPGGQATNTTETQVTSILVFDGIEVCRAQSQDTRSQNENKKIADKRLFERVLSREIEKWKVAPPDFAPIMLNPPDISLLAPTLLVQATYLERLFLNSILEHSAS